MTGNRSMHPTQSNMRLTPLQETPDKVSNPVGYFQKALMGPDSKERKGATNFFEVASNPKRINVFVAALCHDEPSIKKWAIKMLEKVSPELTDDNLLVIGSFLNMHEPNIRLASVKALSVIGHVGPVHAKFSNDVLISHLEVEKDNLVIDTTIELLWSAEAENRNNRCFEDLLKILAYDNSLLRQTTLSQVRKYRELIIYDDLKVLKKILDNEKPEKQLTALEAFRIIDKPHETSPLITSFLDGGDIENKDGDVIISAFDVLIGMRRAPEVVEYLDKAGEDPRFQQFREEIENICEDTARLAPKDSLKKKSELPEKLELSDAVKKIKIKKIES